MSKFKMENLMHELTRTQKIDGLVWRFVKIRWNGGDTTSFLVVILVYRPYSSWPQHLLSCRLGGSHPYTGGECQNPRGVKIIIVPKV
jgi:hypothetical protein